MRQYTTRQQTQHLIAIGFPLPQSVCLSPDNDIMIRGAYSIGELISFLVNPKIEDLAEVYRVEYDGADKPFIEKELIDALYFACEDIKEKNYKDLR